MCFIPFALIRSLLVAFLGNWACWIMSGSWRGLLFSSANQCKMEVKMAHKKVLLIFLHLWWYSSKPSECQKQTTAPCWYGELSLMMFWHLLVCLITWMQQNIPLGSFPLAPKWFTLLQVLNYISYLTSTIVFVGGACYWRPSCKHKYESYCMSHDSHIILTY